MAASANVQSIAALKEFRVALCLFAEAVRSALSEADADLQRHSSWLSDDRERYWRSELNRRNEQIQRAKIVLLQKKLEKTASGGHPSCVDEEKALALAKRQLEEAQQKSESTKRWVRRLEELVFQHKGPLQGLSYALDNDVVNMLAMLDRMVEALNKYIELAAPAAMGPESAASESPSIARPVEEQPADVTQDVQKQEDTETQAQAERPSNLPENGSATQQEHKL